VEAGSRYQYGQPIPAVKYSPEELGTWGVVYRKLKDYSQKYAVKQVRPGPPVQLWCSSVLAPRA
jgi:hypothetical protein